VWWGWLCLTHTGNQRCYQLATHDDAALLPALQVRNLISLRIPLPLSSLDTLTLSSLDFD
jgi:hypothetical protein